MTITLTPWMTGTPTHEGWFVASFERDADVRRYWNGALWSAPCYATDPQAHFDRARNTVGETQEGIAWCELGGNPARVDWYVTSQTARVTMERYFDGDHWSAPCCSDDSAEDHERARSTRGETQVGIEWCERMEREPLAA